MFRSVPSGLPGSALLRMMAMQGRSYTATPILLAPKKAPKPTSPPAKKKPTKAAVPTPLEDAKQATTATVSASDAVPSAATATIFTPTPTQDADVPTSPFDAASPEELFFVQAAREGKEFLGSVPKWVTTPVPVVPLTRAPRPAHHANKTARAPTWHCGMCRSRNADTTSHCARCGSGKSLSSIVEEQHSQDSANDGDDLALTASIGTPAANDPSFAEEVDSNGPKLEVKRLQRIMPTRAPSGPSSGSSYPQGGAGYNKPGGYQKAPYQQGGGQQGGYQKPPYQQGGYQKPPYQQGEQGGYQKPPYQQGGYQKPPYQQGDQGGYQKPPYQQGGYQKPPYQQGEQGGYQKPPYQQGGYQKPPYQPGGYQQPQGGGYQGGAPQQQQAASQPWRP